MVVSKRTILLFLARRNSGRESDPQPYVAGDEGDCITWSASIVLDFFSGRKMVARKVKNKNTPSRRQLKV